MKNWILIITFFLSQYMAVGQWIEQNSGTSENLNEVQFTSDVVGYIVGDNGTLLKTIDGGENWNSLPSGTSQDLISLWFLNNEVGFIGGETGFASKTEDGGDTWQSLNLSLSNAVELYFINNDIGFLGTKNQIFRTIDNGENWDETELINVQPFFSSIYEFGFATDLIGYAVNGLALKTEDGGQTWTYIVDSSHPDYNDANALTSCEALEDIVYFGSTYYQGLYSTTDGGTSLDFEPKVIDAIDFPSSSVGYAIQRTNDNHIIKTIDGGETWDIIFTETNILKRMNDIHFVGENRGWVVGSDGLILHTENTDTQSWRFPDCSDLEITKVVWSPNSADTLLVTVFNNCNTCETHVYTGLIAYQNMDTLAINEELETKPTPPNNDEHEYALFKLSDFEISDDIRFKMVSGICDSIPYAANVILDIEATENDIEIELYPNPTQDILNLKIPVDLTIYSIKLLDVQGKTLLEADKNARQFNIKNYVNGTYLIAIDTDKGLLSRKINIIK